MSTTHFKELDLFAQIADAIGGTLEEVYNMQERERKDLITVLGLEELNYNDNYQEASPSMERSKYRTRTVAKKEKETEREVNVPVELEDGIALSGEEIPEEALEKDLNGNIITSDRDIIISDVNNETKESDPKAGDKESAHNQRKTMVKQSTSANSPDIISDLPPTPPVTQGKSSARSRLSLKRKGRNTSVPKTKPKQITEPSLDSPDQFAPMEVTHQPLSGYRQPVPSFLIQKLSSPSSLNIGLPGSSSQPSLPSKMLSSHPLPVQDVLARHDLPLHQGQQVAGGGGDWREYRGEFDNVFEKISKFKSQGLVHAGTEGGIIWTDQNMNNRGKKSGTMVKEKKELRRSTRKVKKSFSISDSVFVSGDWALSSEEEVRRETPSEVKMSKKSEDNNGLPVEDEGYDEAGEEGESEEKKKRGVKRKLFSKNKDYMDDSAESGEEDKSFDEEERKRKYPGTRNGLRRTLDSLKNEGSFSDL